MTRKPKLIQRGLSWLLSMAMIISLLPVSAFAANPARIDDSDPRVKWSANNWKVYNNEVHFRETKYNATPDEAFDTVEVPFTGTGIKVIGKLAVNGTIMTASIDKGEPVDVDFFGDQNKGGEQLVWEVKGLEPGDHTLVLTNTNRHNKQAHPLPDAKGNYQPEINYFEVLNEKPVKPEAPNFADGVKDAWTVDNERDGVICAVEKGWLHLKSGVSNGNNPGQSPAMFVNPTTFNFNKAGFFEFTLKSNNTNRGQGDSDRFGVFLGYSNASGKETGMMLGYDSSGGWFWQRYYNGPDDYFTGTRPVGAPAKGQEVKVRLEWNDNKEVTLLLDGKAAFTNVSFAPVGELLGNKIAIKGGSWNPACTDVLLKDIHYVGQAKVEGYSVTGKVVDKNGKAVANAAVTLNGKTVRTNNEGVYTFAEASAVPTGEYELTVEAEGYAAAAAKVVVGKAAVTVDNVTMTALPGVTGTVVSADKTPVPGAQVILTQGDKFQKVVFADDQGAFALIGVPAGEYKIAAKADFYYNADEQDLIVGAEGSKVELALEPMKTDVLSTDAMDVTVSTDFPTALKYDMKGKLEGKTMYGQTRSVRNILINNTVWAQVGDVTATKKGANIMQYTIPVTALDKNRGVDVEAVIRAELKAEDNVLTFTITGVDYPRKDRLVNPVEQIYFFDQSLASVRSSEKDAKLATATLAPNTLNRGDVFADVTKDFDIGRFNNTAVRYAFLANGQLSAGVFSNSDVGPGGAAGSDNNRVVTTAVDRGAYKNVGASSNQWYYDRKISSVDPSNAHDVDGVLNAEQKVVGIREGRDQAPYVKVVITGEMNNDSVIDWQDAAIAARDQKVVHIPVHSDTVPDVITTRIAMNFQSEAPNPFLTTLDNVKRVALHSDGLGQSVLLKGYASEGHDSGHPDYYDIGERMGGVDDFKTMLTEGHKLGAQFGIHTNASEFYPEADAFNNNAVRWNGTRNAKNPKVHYGWNWLDQGIAMNGVYDLATDNRYHRYSKLHDLVGDNTNGGDGLDYIYVDVWGNNTSGSENAWHTRKLSNDITAGGNNWRIVHEWSFANDWDSTFQHWVSDFAYGNYADKGRLNSTIMRFMLNSHKDSWTPDFPSYGGAANAPLLGGPVMQGFEGWQSDYEYDQFIETLYNQMIPTKFLQHFDAMNWVTSDKTVTLPYGAGAGDFNWNNTSNWNPDVQITLRGQDNRKDQVVVTRGSDDQINESYAYGTPEQRLEYRSRYITLNGKVILEGASNPGEFKPERSVEGNLRYLIPWYWDNQGKQVAPAAEKLYHYNVKGGTTTWQLPDGWDTLENVTVYKLTDQGRDDKQTVTVNKGSVTLTAEAMVPYVVVKGAEAKAPQVTWTAKGQHLTDVSFNGSLNAAWNPQGDAKIVKTTHDTPMLQLNGESSVRQTLTDLTAGEKYAVYVGVDNKSNAKASITILDSKGNVVASEYTLRSFVSNVVGSYVHQNASKDPSCFQNMYVFFTPVEGETYTLVLSREAGEGVTLFDDVRVAERGIMNVQKKGEAGAPGVAEIKDHYTYDEKGNFVKFEQDFEHVTQGLYPFVAYNGGWVTDCRMHLSKLHAPYTQAGWDTKKADDVLDGNWSVKINGQVQRGSLMYTTIPQNFHFEAGKQYVVEFDYQMGSEGTYEAVVLDGGVNAENVTQRTKLYKSLGKTAHAVMVVTGSESGQTGVGIWSTNVAPQVPNGAHGDFGGYKDFMLDNLTIRPLNAGEEVTLIDIDKNVLNKGETSDITVTTVTGAKDASNGITKWESSEPSIAYVKDNKVMAVDAGEATVTAVLADGSKRSFDITVIGEADVRVSATATANTEEKSGEPAPSGPAAAAADGNPSSYWHSQWNGGGFNVNPQNPAILTVDLGAAQYVDKFIIQQRPSGPNGMVQKFTYELKDESGENVLKTAEVSVPGDKQRNGAIMEIPTDTQGVRYIVVKITQGYGGFASLAEVGLPPRHVTFTDRASLKDVTVAVGSKYQMKPITAVNEMVMGAQWASADAKTAAIDGKGEISALAEGKSVITLSNACGKLATANVYVVSAEKLAELTAAAAEVDKLIAAIGDVTLDSEKAITEARAAYKALGAEGQTLVKDLATLEAAEKKLAELQEGAELPFTDVSKDDWYYDAVKYVVNKHIFAGTSKTTFEPEIRTTRAMMVQVLYNLAGKPKVDGKASFKDVDPNEWYAEAISWAVKNKVAAGYGDGRFGPDDMITREQMAVILWNYAKHPAVEDENFGLKFDDTADVSEWAMDGLTWANYHHIINGIGNNLVAPQNTASRAEIAAMMKNYDQNMRG